MKSVDQSDQTVSSSADGDEVVIFLVAQDDVATVRTKLEQVHGRRVALVIPPFTLALRRAISMRLLRRVAEGLAIQLSIVTADGEVQRFAREEDLPVFTSVRSFRRYSESADGAPPPRSVAVGLDRGMGVLVAAGSLVAVTLIVLIVAFALIPVANVTLRPATEPLGETIEMRADPASNSIDYVGRRIPARAIYDKVDGTDQLAATGAGQTNGSRAQGRVIFSNQTRQEVSVPAGTVVSSTTGMKFVVLEEVRLPMARGAWARAEVRAVDAGAGGNVPRGGISMVEGPLAQQVAVFNEEPTEGGGASGLGVVTEADRQRLRDQLYDRLSREALAKLRLAVQPSETLLPLAIKVDVLEANFDRRVNEQARVVNLQMVVRVHATVFEEREANNLAKRAWQPRVRTGFAIVPESVKLGQPEFARLEGPTADVVVLRQLVDGTAAARIGEEQVVAAVRGANPRKAIDQLASSFMLAERPQLAIEPAWAKRAFRIQVKITTSG